MTHAETVIESGPTETHFLRYDSPIDEGTIVSVRALVFGHLVVLAKPFVEFYHSDFYHDALWLAKHLDGIVPFAFYFSADDTGTHIGQDRDLVVNYREHAWHCRVEATDNGYGSKFTLTVTTVK